MRILFTGGGTGGHVFPIIAVKQAFENAPDFNFYYLGADGFAKSNLEKQGIKSRFILAGGFRRYFSLQTPFDLLKNIIGIIQSFFWLFVFIPDVIFSKGGYGSFPVVLVAWVYKIPVVLHDSDSVPGLANKILAKFAKTIILSFPESEKYFKKKSIVIGNPVRKDLLDGDKLKAKELFKLSDKPLILIIGGSQGAQKINQIVLDTLPRLLDKYEIIHICGEKNFKSVQEQSKELLKDNTGYHLFPFLEAEQLKHAFTADLIINRSGAGSIFEIAALGKPSILIPISKSAQDHQRKNAYEFAKNDKAIVIEQENLIPNLFLETIFNLLNDPNKLKQMGDKAMEFYNIKTPEMIKDEILKKIKV
ncbi:MAG: undecaprenyldiphospho-muramoylpentapeptide beta-N-acetylglucosaminyltransferase [Patescibacteria group bacterium]